MENTIISDFSLAKLLPIMNTSMCLLGLDYGEKKIGVAVSDTRKVISSNLKIILNKRPSHYISEIREICEKRNVGGIVIGLPLNMNGSEGPRCQSTRSFAEKLQKAGLPPTAFWDERLSTLAAENILLEANTSRRKRALVVDIVAANIILQGALDRLQNAFRKNMI